MSAMLHEVTPNPVEDIQGAITAETEDVMGCNVLDLSGFLQQIELWQDGNSFEKDGECPDNFKNG